MARQTRIPIHLTHDEARSLLEAEHAIEYRDGILGATVQAACRCGWTSPKLTTGWIAQEAAQRHRVAFIIHPLENRARYAIYRATCRACNGEAVLSGRDGADLGECPFCFRGHLWTILDRTGEDLDRYAASQGFAMAQLWDDIQREAGR